MKCERVMRNFLTQDDGRYLSLLIRLHILLCSECRKEIQRMQNIFENARRTSSYAIPEDLSDMIMRRIYNSNVTYKKDISSIKWFFTGVIIFASIILVSYSESFIWLRDYFGSGLDIPLYMVLGLAITFYAASYIGTHLEDVKKFAEFIGNKIHQ